MISKGCLAQSQRYPGYIFLVISNIWTDSQGAVLIDVIGPDGNDTVYVRDLEVISEG